MLPLEQYSHIEELVQAAQQGDAHAIDQVLRAFQSLVRKKARSYFLLGADVEDVHQEGMIGLFKAIRDYNPSHGASFYAFASLCITRQIITAVKTATRLKHMPLNGAVSLHRTIFDNEDRTLEDLIRAESSGPEELLLQQEEANWLFERIHELLTEYERQVLALYAEGVGYGEIGVRLGRSEKSVDNAIWRIKTKLRKKGQAEVG